MFSIILTFPKNWLRPAVTIEHDPEDPKPWRVCKGKQIYPFLTYRECLCFCFGRRWLKMVEAVDYCANHATVG